MYHNEDGLEMAQDLRNRIVTHIEAINQITNEGDLAEYRTTQLKIQRRIEREFEKSQCPDFFQEFLILFSQAELSVVFEKIKNDIKAQYIDLVSADSHFGSLCRLVNKADKVCPNMGLAVLVREDPLEAMAKSCEPYDLIKQSENQSGEKAARTATRIFREITEHLYDNYVRTVCELTSICEGKSEIISNQNFGSIVHDLQKRLQKIGFSDIVEFDAAFLRNACSHSQWKYVPERDKIILWDLNEKSVELTPEELYQKAILMYQMSVSNLHNVLPLYYKKKLLTDWRHVFILIQHLFSKGDVDADKEMKLIEDEINDQLSSIRHLTFKRK
jgi:hypothetical protein